jgi:hypothetical protein
VAIGGVKILVDRMRMWQARQQARRMHWEQHNLSQSCQALAIIARTQGGMDAVMEEGGIEVALDMFRSILGHENGVPDDDPGDEQRHREAASLLTASRLLEKFIEDQEATMRIIDHGGVSILQDLLNGSQRDEELVLSVTAVLQGVHDTRVRIREKNMSFAKGIYREQALNGSLKPDLVKKILMYADPRTGVRPAVGAGPLR